MPEFNLASYAIGCVIIFVACFIFARLNEPEFTVGEATLLLVTSFIPFANLIMFGFMFFACFLFGTTMQKLYSIKLWG